MAATRSSPGSQGSCTPHRPPSRGATTNQTFTVAAAGVELAAERRPGTGPPVVLLHAGVCDRRSWHGVLEHLEDLDAVVYDRRGFGQTPHTATPYRHVDDLLAVLDAVAPGRPAWLVGNSMGGALALDTALAAPERVAGLVLVGTAVSGAPDPADDELDEPTARLDRAIEAAWEAGELAEANRLEIALWLDGPAGPEGRVGGAARELALDMNRIALEHDPPEGAGESGVDAWSRLAEVTAPVTVTWGDLDLAHVVARSEQLAARLPHVRGTHVFAGTGHLPGLERPAEVAEVVRAAVRAG